MKNLIILLLIMAMVPITHAATDCERNCCRTYDGSWDDDFDDCRSPKTGFDTCVSDCEAAVWASRPTMGDTSNFPKTEVKCCAPSAILLSILGAAVFVERRKR